MATNEERINQIYDSQFAAQREQLAADYEAANADLDEQRAKNQKATDTNLNAAAVQAKKAAVSNAEYYNAAGLSSGARAQARLAQENQLQANLTALRTAQQEADAQIERQRGLLAKEYASAIRQAQAENDLARAQALYQEAQNADAKLLAKQEGAATLLAQTGDFSGYGSLYGLTPEQVTALTNNYIKEKERPDKEGAAQLMAQTGDYSLLGALYGLTPEQVAALAAKYNEEKNATKQEGAAALLAQTGDYSRYGELYGLTPEEISKLNGGATSSGGGGGADGTAKGTGASSVNNGSLSSSQVKQLQDVLDVSVDGLYGSQSSATAGGLSADDAYKVYVEGFSDQNAASKYLYERGAAKEAYAKNGTMMGKEAWDNLRWQYEKGYILSEDEEAIVTRYNSYSEYLTDYVAFALREYAK